LPPEQISRSPIAELLIIAAILPIHSVLFASLFERQTPNPQGFFICERKSLRLILFSIID